MKDYFADFYENACIYLEMESETLNFVRSSSVEFFIYLFLHISGVLNANLSNNILYLMPFPFKLAKQKMTSKITCFQFCCCTSIHIFCFVCDLELKMYFLLLRAR